MTSAQDPRHAQGGGYPPGGYGPPGGQGPGGYGPPGGQGPGGYGPPGGQGPGGYGPPGGQGPGGYGAPPGAPGGYGPPGAPYGAPLPPYNPGSPYGPAGGPPPVPEVKKRAQTWLIVSAASFFFCACGFSIIGAVFCFLAMQAADQGNLEDAENKLKWGKIVTLSGFGLGLVMSIIGFIVYAAQIFAAIASH